MLDRFPDVNMSHPTNEWFINNNKSCGEGHYNPTWKGCYCGEYCGWRGCRWKTAPAKCLMGTNRTWAQKDSKDSNWIATTGKKSTFKMTVYRLRVIFLYIKDQT